MTTSLAVNSKNDIYMDAQNNLATVRDLAAVQQDCVAAMETQLGEVPLNVGAGVPTDATVWAKWKPAQFEAYARRALLSVPNVLSVKSFSIIRVANEARYSATIETSFGPGAVAGSLTQ